MISGINSYNSSLYSRLNAVNMQKQTDQKFARLDTDSSGALSKDEFQILMNEISDQTNIIPDTDKMFELTDTDGDGLLTETEMESARPQGPPPLPPMMEMTDSETTDSLDTNGDGVVNVLDFISDTSETTQLNMQDPGDRMFAKLDTDGDGMLSKSEFQVFADEISQMTGMTIDIDATFESADTDGDGLLSRSEMDKFRPQGPPPMMGMMGNGSVTESDLTSLVEEETDSLMSSIDTNGDGSIDASELKVALMQVKLNAYSMFNDQTDAAGNGSMDLFG
ncbi:EF-hand domain-containing protein [bacterium]|nr:EF-hand domain-containing protein [bacterium]